MAISASSTATGLLRASILLAYCLTVLSLFFITRSFQKNEAVDVAPRQVNVSEIDHVAKRGVGKWAKIRRGHFISGLSSHSSKNKDKSKKDNAKGKKGDPPSISMNGTKSLDKSSITDIKSTLRNQTEKETMHIDPHTLKDIEAPTISIQSRLDTNDTSLKASNITLPVTTMLKTFHEDMNKSHIDEESSRPVVTTKPINTSSGISPERISRLPDCLIIGVRKAGTRPLQQFLRLHPDIKGVGQEVSFFSDHEKYVKGLQWYLEQLPPTRPEKVLIEKSAEYFHSKEAPKRIYDMNPNIKLILIVRDPLERMVSDYYFLQRYAEQINDTNQFQEVNHTLEELCINKTTGRVTHYGGLNRSKYVKHFENWLQWFPRSQILVLNGDKFARNNPAEELTKVEKFLGIHSFFGDGIFYYNATKGFYCTQQNGCLGSEKGHVHPTLAPRFIHTIRSHLKPFNEKFYEIVGENFHWATEYT